VTCTDKTLLPETLVTPARHPTVIGTTVAFCSRQPGSVARFLLVGAGFPGASIFVPQAGQSKKTGAEKPDLHLLHSLIIFPPHHTHSFWLSRVVAPHPEQYRYSIAIWVPLRCGKPLQAIGHRFGLLSQGQTLA
jgi:hypothetical protein